MVKVPISYSGKALVKIFNFYPTITDLKSNQVIVVDVIVSDIIPIGGFRNPCYINDGTLSYKTVYDEEYDLYESVNNNIDLHYIKVIKLIN